MARFKFRLQASLRLAQGVLEEAQRHLAEEISRWQVLSAQRDRQRKCWQAALEGQRLAGLSHPEELGRWQAFAREEYLKLQACEVELLEQEKRKEEKRRQVVETHREKEKFRRLKVRQAGSFALAEQRKEQKLLDEVGQIIYLRTLMAHCGRIRG